MNPELDYFQEWEPHDTPPVPDFGNYLQIKNGELCLRIADEITRDAIAFGLLKTWKRPMGHPWDTDIYEFKTK